jgi:hypothetical protein
MKEGTCGWLLTAGYKGYEVYKKEESRFFWKRTANSRGEVPSVTPAAPIPTVFHLDTN